MTEDWYLRSIRECQSDVKRDWLYREHVGYLLSLIDRMESLEAELHRRMWEPSMTAEAKFGARVKVNPHDWAVL